MEELELAKVSLEEGEGPDKRKQHLDNALLLISGTVVVDQRTPI